MPCNDGGALGGRVEYRDYPAQKKTIDNLTRLLCITYKSLEDSKLANLIPAEAAKWWADHKKKDKARIAAEKAAIAKEIAKHKSELEALEKKLQDAEKP